MDKEHKKFADKLFGSSAESLEIKSSIWEETPVTSREFFEKFIHEPCYPEQQAFVDKVLGRKADEWNSDYTEAIALIGKGGGKDRTIAKIIAYCIYKLLCMRNPQRFLGLNDNDIQSPESAIDIANVSINSRLARDVFFKAFIAIIKATKNPKTGNNWFEEHGLNLSKDILKREVIFPKAITAYSLDSVEYTGEGLNLLLVVFDEVGGFDPSEADSLYKALTSTQKTRFRDKRKTLLLSYKRDDNDFMMIRYYQAKEEAKTHRVKAATWDWNIKAKKSDFAEDYIKSPEDAKRIYECEGSTAKEGYFKYKKRIREAINPNRVNPIVGDKIWTDNILKLEFKDFFIPKKFQAYYVHVDLSKGKESGDYAGIALGHPIKDRTVKLSEEYLQELIKVEGFDVTKLEQQKQTAVVIDLLLQLRARPGEEIIFDEVRQFVQGLKKAGFNIKMVTFDGWQSVDSIQILNNAGIPAEVQSVDRNTEAYDTLKEQIYKGLFDTYEHSIFIRECEELIRKPNGKVDHPDLSYRRSVEEKKLEGSKDVSDSAAGCTKSCVEYSKATFGISTTGGRDMRLKDMFQRPDRAEQEKLVRYGERP